MRSLIRYFTGLAVFLLPALATAALPIHQWTLANGWRVYFVHSDNLPIVDIRLTFDAAAARDGDRAGLARLTNALLDQGNAGLDAGAIARRLDTTGAPLSGGSERDMAWLQLRSLSDKDAFEPAIDTLVQILGAPDFPQADFERHRARKIGRAS